MNKKKRTVFKILIWLLEGIIVGFGAIMPGLSGGALCAAFGMYLPIIQLLSHPKENIRKYGEMIVIFGLGGAIGFVSLSGFAAWLMELNSELVICAFIGFIIGTFPELWEDAGVQGRGKKDYFSMAIAFVAMLTLLFILDTQTQVQMKADLFGYLFCGVLWGLSFIVPGLSSSTLLLFFGLYQPMLDGISQLDLKVIIPIGIGVIACVLLLSKGVNMAYKKFHSVISHAIIGVVAATTVMIYPDWHTGGIDLVFRLICIVGGAALSYFFTRICAKIKNDKEADNAPSSLEDTIDG